MRLSCLCSIASKSLYIPPRITGCHAASGIHQLHGINLAAFHAFSGDCNLTSLLPPTLIRGQPNYCIPSINIYKSNVGSVVHRDGQYSLDFREIAKHPKSFEMVFASDVDYLQYK